MMQKDLRNTSLYQEAEALFNTLRQPGSGQISEAAEIHVSPDGRHAVFAATVVDKLEGSPPTRIARVDLMSGDVQLLTSGPNTDRLPRYSPNGREVAFLSDRRQAGDFQLWLMDSATGAAHATTRVNGWVEYLLWSPDGRHILLGVAGHGADVAGGQGAVTSRQVTEDLPAWMPAVESGGESFRWRQAWVYELATHRVRQVSHADCNVWEATWCGNDALVAIVSPGPSEGLWYSAHLHVIALETGNSTELHAPQDQLGWPAASPSGEQVAVVEAICSDRWIVAGDLLVFDTAAREKLCVDTHGVDITSTEWRSDTQLLLAGHRGLETVVGVYETTSRTFTETWVSREVSAAGQYITVAGTGSPGDCVLVGESFLKAPEIATIRAGAYRCVKSFDLGYARLTACIGAVEAVSWRAPDGLEIQGWLLRPKGAAPHPLVMHLHGGPVWHWRQRWLGRGATVLLLLARGYANFFPNPRGSSGRGRDFARQVVGDLGGADARDCLAGLDHLVDRGVVDRSRIGVTGGSYGGYLSAWLITQDSRFAAAVPVAPVTNHVSAHLLSNIPHFVRAFLADRYTNPGGRYFERSPIMHAHKARTPTLSVCGALDRCTPPAEAVQFHNALLENGVQSVLVTYPQEGHGVRKLPAAIDYATRVVSWFEKYMPAEGGAS